MSTGDPFKRAQSLQRLGTQVLICGALSRTLETALISAGIQVVPYNCGQPPAHHVVVVNTGAEL